MWCRRRDCKGGIAEVLDRSGNPLSLLGAPSFEYCFSSSLLVAIWSSLLAPLTLM